LEVGEGGSESDPDELSSPELAPEADPAVGDDGMAAAFFVPVRGLALTKYLAVIGPPVLTVLEFELEVVALLACGLELIQLVMEFQKFGARLELAVVAEAGAAAVGEEGGEGIALDAAFAFEGVGVADKEGVSPFKKPDKPAKGFDHVIFDWLEVFADAF